MRSRSRADQWASGKRTIEWIQRCFHIRCASKSKLYWLQIICDEQNTGCRTAPLLFLCFILLPHKPLHGKLPEPTHPNSTTPPRTFLFYVSVNANKDTLFSPKGTLSRITPVPGNIRNNRSCALAATYGYRSTASRQLQSDNCMLGRTLKSSQVSWLQSRFMPLVNGRSCTRYRGDSTKLVEYCIIGPRKRAYSSEFRLLF